jgi:hypothetical protein
MTLTLYLACGIAGTWAFDALPADDTRRGPALVIAAACIALWPLVLVLYVIDVAATLLAEWIGGAK